METTAQIPAHRHIVCWKSSLAGLAISLVSFAGLLALGAAFGGVVLSGGTTTERMTVLTALSLVLTVFISAFVGAYYSVRISRTKVDLAGTAQGALVGALLLLIAFWQAGSAVGTMTKATGMAIGGIAAGASEAAVSPWAADVVEDAMGDLKLRSEPSVVVKGVASRLLRGDQESAKNYLAYQASLSPQQADQRMNEIKAKVDAAAVKAREAAATALKASGWTIFLLTALGLISSCIGGFAATKANERYFWDTSDEEVQRARTLHIKAV